MLKKELFMKTKVYMGKSREKKIFFWGLFIYSHVSKDLFFMKTCIFFGKHIKIFYCTVRETNWFIGLQRLYVKGFCLSKGLHTFVCVQVLAINYYK